MKSHEERVDALQNQIIASRHPLSFSYGKGHSNTTRSKAYNRNSAALDYSPFHHVIAIKPDEKIAVVEPRVTMEQLVDTVLPFGLVPKVVPEFKGITCGGAIMGSAAESSSYRFGTFNDTCREHQILSDAGEKLTLTQERNASLFHGIAGSYGSLGALTSTTVELYPAKKNVFVKVETFDTISKALLHMQELLKNETWDYLDGLVYAPHHICLILAKMTDAPANYSKNGPWFFQRVPKMNECVMDLKDYLFRYDLGAFWMGDYLFKPKLLAKFFTEGVWKIVKEKRSHFSEEEIKTFCSQTQLSALKRLLAGKRMESQNLWALLHRAEKWVQGRFLIQDFCLPFSKAHSFYEMISTDPATFPLWLCPIKSTNHLQIFSPHRSQEPYILNFGIYGLPSYAEELSTITKKLEIKTKEYGGRKVLYSTSYYTEEEFWEIYSKPEYLNLRKIASPLGKWRQITEKVLSY